MVIDLHGMQKRNKGILYNYYKIILLYMEKIIVYIEGKKGYLSEIHKYRSCK
jgi:hypothetical protein